MAPGDRVVNLGCGEGPQAVVYRGQYSEMVGVEINESRLARAVETLRDLGVDNFTPLHANVERTPLPDGSFDKVLAVDIIEHVEHPEVLCGEARRLLKKGGELLITYPAMHDKFADMVLWVGRRLLRRRAKEPESDAWNPDEHNQAHPLREWVALTEDAGFTLVRSRATTMFPPLHRYGVPRFWFSIGWVHRLDSFLARRRLLRGYGQTLMCVFKKR